MVIDAHDHFFICMAHPVDDVMIIDPGVAAGGAERMAQIMWTDRAAAVLGHLPAGSDQLHVLSGFSIPSF